MGSRTAVSSSTNGGRNAASSQYEGPLVRQNSLYNLTLEEVQNHLGDGGKQLSSMNMDELLKNILNTDDGGAAHAQSMSMLMNGNGNGNGNSNGNQMLPSNSALQRQGSITLSRTLSRKSVEEVWRDIQEGQGQGQGKENEEKKSSHQQQQQQRQQTFGEMTLEDFLAKAGVGIARDDNGNANNNNTSSSPSNVNVGMQDAAASHTVSMIQPAPMDVMNIHHHQPQPQPQPEWFPYQFNNSQSMMMASYGPKRGGVPTGNPILDAGYNDNQLTLSSPLVPCTSSDSTTPGRKRGAPESIIEKTVERRQKRMIKNRESAARSRARKQAYTNELENEVMQLKEENERLRKQQALEKLLPSVPPPQPKHTLRRTTSAFF